MKTIAVYQAVIVLAVFSIVRASEAGNPLTIETGRITGVSLGKDNDIRAYKGIPFAAPPTGANRWRAPQPAKPWSDVRACVEYSATCPQPTGATGAFGPLAGRINEDCLYLNVFTPAKSQKDPLPVMVWFFGGGFLRGDAAFYDMERLARAGVVVVTVNYRVGVFGFLAHKELTDESTHASSGNYGLLDMIAALQWVRRNISAFGGTPDNVTIFGQSSGASGVCHLLASPLTRGLFHRAISQSNGTYNPDPPLKTMEENGAKFIAALTNRDATSTLATARGKTWQEALECSQNLMRDEKIRFGVNIDGWVLVDVTSEVFAKGSQHNVPLLIGSNANESDQEYTAGARHFARCHSKLNPDTYRYFFTQKSKDPRFGGKGAVHSTEIVYVLKGNARMDDYFDEQDWSLSNVMSECWVQFARKGNPAAEGRHFEWPRYNAETDTCLEFGSEIKPVHAIRAAICDAIDKKTENDIAKWKAIAKSPPFTPAK